MPDFDPKDHPIHSNTAPCPKCGREAHVLLMPWKHRQTGALTCKCGYQKIVTLVNPCEGGTARIHEITDEDLRRYREEHGDG